MQPFYFLNIYKEKGITSFDVIFKLRKILGIKRIGHAGTLDPMAEGVMQVAIGFASRLLEFLPSDKEYIAEIAFGYISTTLDKEGEITKTQYMPNFNRDELLEVIKQFEGKITQIPPKFSAIKINGQKLCDIARKNPEKEIEIPIRRVFINKIELLNFDPINYTAKIKIECSKGTYIRTLADDIAKKLDTRAYLTSLLRTRAGNFKIENSIYIKDVTKDIKGIEPVLALDLPKYYLTDNEFNLTKNGVKIKSKHVFMENEVISLIYKEKLVSIGVLSDNMIVIKKNFSMGDIE